MRNLGPPIGPHSVTYFDAFSMTFSKVIFSRFLDDVFYDLLTGRPCVFIAIYNEDERFPLLRKDKLTVEKGIEKR